MRRYSLSLTATDWLLIGYIAGIVLWFVADAATADPDASGTTAWTEQTVTLTEDHLRRLEDGDTVAVQRWHGHELLLGGGMVIDAEMIGEEGEEDR